MTALSEMGAVIAPPVPAFYAKPQSLDDMIDQTLGRILDLFDLETGPCIAGESLRSRTGARSARSHGAERFKGSWINPG